MDVYIHDTYFSVFNLKLRSLTLVPPIGVLLVGLIVCIRHRHVRPRQAWFGGAAILLIMMQLSPVADVVRGFLIADFEMFPDIAMPRRYADPYRVESSDLIGRFFMVALMDSVLASIEFGLLLWAMFGPDGGQRNRHLVENVSANAATTERGRVAVILSTQSRREKPVEEL